MKQFIKYLFPLILLAGLFYACDSLNNMVKKHPTDATYTQTPEPMEMHADKVKVNVAGEFKPKYFNKKAGMVFQPELQYEGGSYLLKPVALKGDKVTNIDGTTISNANGGKFSYNEEIPYKPEYQAAKLVVNPVVYTAKNAKTGAPKTASEALAVKKATLLTEKVLATGINTTPELADNNAAKPTLVSDKYQKDVTITKLSALYFEHDKSDLNKKLDYNKKGEQSFNDFIASFNDTAYELGSIVLNAWASPEGEETRNSKLSDNRSKTAEKYINDSYKKYVDDAVKAMKLKKAKDIKAAKDSLTKKINIVATAKGEDWDGFVKAVQESDIKDKATIINIVKSNENREKKEKEIRNMTVIYPQVESVILPALRRAEFAVTLKQIMKTDAQILALAIDTLKCADLTIEEILYASTLTDSIGAKLKIFNNATKVYPQDWRGFNNLGYYMIIKCDKHAKNPENGGSCTKAYEEAKVKLDKALELNPNSDEVLNNLGVCALKQGNIEDAKKYLNDAKAKGNKEADGNLAYVNIKEGNYDAAASSLTGQNNINLALALILKNDLPAAKKALESVKDSPKKSYLSAIVAAREKNEPAVYSNLKATNEEYKKKATTDVEFRDYAKKVDFLNAVK